jgi:hypothetical protein
MAYENTSVAVPKSQEKIRRLILDNGGTGIAFISQPPREGFEAQVSLGEKSYHIRVVAVCSKQANPKKRDQEERRVWRVLYHHMKAIYEASKTGVLEFREMMMPYIVTSSGQTLAEHILPSLDKAVAGYSPRLLSGPVA